jgi:D-threo-aldose 1-dehydrogenase
MAAQAPEAMSTRRLGRRGPMVTVLGFGGAPLGDLYAPLDDATAIDTVIAALDAGIRLVDTSPLYGRGLSEHRIGTALRRRSGVPVVLSTKVGRVLSPAPLGVTREEGYAGGLPHEARFDYSYDGALRSLEQSMLRLGVAAVDVALVHDIDPWTHGDDAPRRQREALGGALRALADLRADNAVRAIGIGVNDADVAERFVRESDIDVVLLAGRYSLLEQPALDRFLPLALERGVGVMLGGVFNSGILATGAVSGARYNYRPAPSDIASRVAAIGRVCEAHGVTLPHAALAFVLGHPAVSSVVLGAVSPDEIRRNVAAFAAPVPAALWGELKAERLLRDDAPVPA